MTPPSLLRYWLGWRLACDALLRGAVCWLLVRGLVGVVPGIAGPTLVILAVAAVVAVVDARRRRLSIVLANLGVPTTAVIGYWLLPVLALELATLASGVDLVGLIERLA